MSDDLTPELDSLLREADDHFEHACFEKAIDIYKYVIIRYGDNSLAAGHANASLGLIFSMLRQDGLAETHLKKAINCEPDNHHHHYLLGCLYSSRYKWEQAIRELTIAVDKEPNNSEYLCVFGVTIFGFGNKKRGIDYLHKALHPGRSGVVVLNSLATAYLALGYVDRAKLYAQKAVQIAPDYIESRVVLRKIDDSYKKHERPYKRTTTCKVRGLAHSSSFVKIYQLEIFPRSWPDMRRIIEIKGNQSLSSLHKIISRAFNRSHSHVYEFLYGDGLDDEIDEQTLAGLDGPENRAHIDSLCQRLGQRFFYLSQDSERLWHEIIVTELRYEVPCSQYPRVMQGNGNLLTLYPCEFSLKVPTLTILEGASPSN